MAGHALWKKEKDKKGQAAQAKKTDEKGPA